jgi:DNA-binding CsgD family transcriptional regulator
MLRIAAAGGSRIAHGLLVEVAAAAGVPEAELEEALRVAIAAQLVVADPDGGYEFRHALVREAVHDDLLPGEHARLHAHYAAAIEAKPQLVAAGRAPADIAHHWYAAHDHPRALVAALAAARAARTRYAYAEQGRLLERTLELWEQVPDAAERLGMDHLALLEQTLAATFRAGDFSRAVTLTRAALAEVDSAAEPLRAARLLNQRGRLLRILGTSDGAEELRRAYRLIADVGEDPRRVRLIAELASHLAQTRQPDAVRIAGEAMAAGQRLGDPSSLLAATLAVARARDHTESTDARLADLHRAAAQARALDDAPNLVTALVNISDVLYELGRYAESAQVAADGMVEANRVGIIRSSGAFLLSNQAEALVAVGRWAEADALCAQAARLDPPGTLALHWLQVRARLRLAWGHPNARELIERALGFLGRPFIEMESRLRLHELRISSALDADETDAALDAARVAIADRSIAEYPRYGWALLAAVARAAVAGKDEPLRERVRSVAAGQLTRHPAERAYAAQVAASLAGEPDARPAWRAAVAAWRADGQPYALAGALHSLAEAEAAAGDRAAVAAALDEVRAIAIGLGARPLRERAETLGRRVGLPAAGRGGPGEDLLTAREQEVLRLVAEGHSNSRIAGALFISPKTVSVHVSRIIAKLAVANRVEAAALAHRLGLLPAAPPTTPR